MTDQERDAATLDAVWQAVWHTGGGALLRVAWDDQHVIEIAGQTFRYPAEREQLIEWSKALRASEPITPASPTAEMIDPSGHRFPMHRLVPTERSPEPRDEFGDRIAGPDDVVFGREGIFNEDGTLNIVQPPITPIMSGDA